jgi:hypothetical protein
MQPTPAAPRNSPLAAAPRLPQSKSPSASSRWPADTAGSLTNTLRSARTRSAGRRPCWHGAGRDVGPAGVLTGHTVVGDTRRRAQQRTRAAATAATTRTSLAACPCMIICRPHCASCANTSASTARSRGRTAVRTRVRQTGEQCRASARARVCLWRCTAPGAVSMWPRCENLPKRTTHTVARERVRLVQQLLQRRAAIDQVLLAGCAQGREQQRGTQDATHDQHARVGVSRAVVRARAYARRGARRAAPRTSAHQASLLQAPGSGLAGRAVPPPARGARARSQPCVNNSGRVTQHARVCGRGGSLCQHARRTD